MDCSLSKILIVDDYESNQVALANVLQPIENVKLYFASSGNEALKLLINNSFSIILLDVNMPDMDGYEVAELISNTQAYQHTPIVMLTAHEASSENILKAYDCGAIDYITKPIEAPILLNKVKQFIRIDRLQNQTDYLSSERELILEAAGQGVIKLNDAGEIQFANTKSLQLFNLTRKQVLKTHLNKCFKISLSDDANTFDLFNQIKTQVSKRSLYQLQEVTLISQQKDPTLMELTCTSVHQHDNTVYIVVFQDITKRVVMENKLTRLANYDQLTQLVNRAYFNEHIERAIFRSQRIRSTVTLLMLDLDQFKLINDTLGHDVGDGLLKEVATRISTTLRINDIAARFGGDEFAVLLEDCTSVIDADQVAAKLVNLVAQPFIIQGNEIFIETSIGIASSENGEADQATLLKWADIALYEAKSAGRNCYQRFIQTMSDERKKKAHIQSQLRHIIDNQAINIHYQPQYSVSEQKIIGFEALARWPSEGYGTQIISPADFIPIAEQSYLIHELGFQILRSCCLLLSTWRFNNLTQHLTLSVNLSAKQLNAPDFLDQLKTILSNYQFPMNKLILEITETAILNRSASVLNCLDVIKSMGVGLALDDFGTGYSSLKYLQNLPFDIIKIDQCFIQNIDTCQKNNVVIKAVVDIAKAYKMDVVAEGVENEEQLQGAVELGCDKIQGFYFSKAVKKSEINGLLTQDLTGCTVYEMYKPKAYATM
jgi:diguanylate cyclase (GGDEF)-like protein